MNADAFRKYYEYHFAENRKLWDSYITQLSDEQFTRTVDYSRGSIQNQVLHLINADTMWFSGLRGQEGPEELTPADVEDRNSIRAHWDTLEKDMRGYLANLQDVTLFEKPFEGEDKNLIVWQVLLHVVNHGTDHRAQILRLLNDFGVETSYQDYIFHVFANP